MPLARGAERLVLQPLAVLLVEHAHPPAEDDGAGLAARGGDHRGSQRIFVVSRRGLAAGLVSGVRKLVGGHGRVDVHAVRCVGLDKTLQDQVSFPFVAWKMKVYPFSLPSPGVSAGSWMRNDFFARAEHGMR